MSANGTSEKCRERRAESAVEGIVLQKSFCTGGRKFCGLPVRLSCKNAGASSPHVKPTSDFANTSEAIQFGDCFLFDSFAKNSSPCNFRLLQQYLPFPDSYTATKLYYLIISSATTCRAMARPAVIPIRAFTTIRWSANSAPQVYERWRSCNPADACGFSKAPPANASASFS